MSFSSSFRAIVRGSFRAKSRNLLFSLFLLFASAANAQDSVPVFAKPNGSLLRAGTLNYQTQLLHLDGSSTPLGTRAVTVTEYTLGGIPTWLIVEGRNGTVVPTLDSVTVNRADLTPIHWSSAIGNAQLAVSFTPDSAYGVLQNYQGRSSFVVGVPGNLLLSGAHAERVIEMLPLAEGYRAMATMLLVNGPSPTLMPAQIVVEGQEDADVNGKRVPSWRVALRAGALEARYWVSLQGTRVVRTEQALIEGLMVGILVP